MNVLRLLARLALAGVALIDTGAAWAGGLPRALRVEVVQGYEYRRPSSVAHEPIPSLELSVLETVEDMLLAAGVEPLPPDTAGGGDGAVRVVLRGRAVGGTYMAPVSGYLYTGARIGGDIAVERSGRPTVLRDFASEVQRPFEVTLNLGYDDPANAPFDAALLRPGGFLDALTSALAQAWGLEMVTPSLDEADPALRRSVAAFLGDSGDPEAVPALLAALEDEEDRVRWEAAWSLGRLKDARALPALIDTLRDESEDVRWFSAWSLRHITGADPGSDHESWRAWFESREADAGS